MNLASRTEPKNCYKLCMYDNIMQENRVLDVPLTQMGVMDQQVVTI